MFSTERIAGFRDIVLNLFNKETTVVSEDRVTNEVKYHTKVSFTAVVSELDRAADGDGWLTKLTDENGQIFYILRDPLLINKKKEEDHRIKVVPVYPGSITEYKILPQDKIMDLPLECESFLGLPRVVDVYAACIKAGPAGVTVRDVSSSLKYRGNAKTVRTRLDALVVQGFVVVTPRKNTRTSARYHLSPEKHHIQSTVVSEQCQRVIQYFKEKVVIVPESVLLEQLSTKEIESDLTAALKDMVADGEYLKLVESSDGRRSYKLQKW